MTAASDATMTELMHLAYIAVAADHPRGSGDDLPGAMARWVKDNHDDFEEPPLSFGERAAKAFLDAGHVEPEDPGDYVRTWNQYFSTLIFRSSVRP